MTELSDLTESNLQLAEDIFSGLSNPKDIVSTYSKPEDITEGFQEYISD